jgi:demethoxyubiquinone hydroxylase (CLK1/Coq7/Cat5 family)
MANSVTVYFDGACPLCRREIAWYRRRPGSEAITWIDVSQSPPGALGPDLCEKAAMARFHVRLADGRLVSGARAFGELWKHLPGLQMLGRLARMPLLETFFEGAYRTFLRARPGIQRMLWARWESADPGYPRWLERELRSDHAGETGAVAIYRGILAVSRDASVREFAKRHVQTETRHLQLMEERLPRERRSRLLMLWRFAGFITGALPALFGPRAVYVTIDAVETFVDRHYSAQIEALASRPEWHGLRDVLEACRADEVEHRDEARNSMSGPRGVIARIWTRMVALGSAAGVAVARRL